MGTVFKFGFSNNITSQSNAYRNIFNNKTAPEIAITGAYQIPTVFIEMDDLIHYGPNNISYFNDFENVIAFTEKKFFLPTFSKLSRSQLPFDIAFARTIHSAQGVTAKEDVVYSVPEKNFCEFLSYVALSRCGSLTQLHLFGRYLTKAHFSIPEAMKNAIEAEYLRLKTIIMLS